MTTSHRNLLRVGEQLGNLRLSRLIAEGGMGVLYEARHVLLGRAQAVKLLHPAFAHDATTCARFRLEAQLAASLDSDHVVPVREYGNADDGTPYFVMDLLEGVDLASLIATEAPLPVVRVADLILDACRGLRAAHEHEPPIIHRDLKPANLFVCQQDDGREILKILDFGIAKLLDSRHGDSITLTGAVLGTPHYMAPEVAERAGPIDARTDIYSLGAVLYEALSARKAHPGSSYTEVLSHILLKKPVPIDSLRGDLPPGLVAIVNRAMDPDPRERFQTVAELAEALACFRANRGDSHAHAIATVQPSLNIPEASPPLASMRPPQPPGAPTLTSVPDGPAKETRPKPSNVWVQESRLRPMVVRTCATILAGTALLVVARMLFSAIVSGDFSLRLEANIRSNPGFPMAELLSSLFKPNALATGSCRCTVAHDTGVAAAEPRSSGHARGFVDSGHLTNLYLLNRGSVGLQNIRVEGDSACTTGKGIPTFGGFGLYLDRSGEFCPPCAYDASDYSGVRFRLCGKVRSGHVRFGIATVDTTSVERGGRCTPQDECDDYHGHDIDLAAGAEHVVYFDRLEQEGRGIKAAWNPQAILSLIWRVDGRRGSPGLPGGVSAGGTADFDDLCVENIELVRSP